MVLVPGESSLLDEQVMSADAAIEVLKRADVDGETHATELLVEQDPLEIRVKAVEAATGFARTHRIKRALFDSRSTASSRASTPS